MHIKVTAEINPKSFVKFMYGLQYTKEFRFAGFISLAFGILLIIMGLLNINPQKSIIFLVVGPLTIFTTPLLLFYVYKKIFNSKYSGVISYDITDDRMSTIGINYSSSIEWTSGLYNLKEYPDWFVVFKQSEKRKVFDEIIPKDAFNENQLIELRFSLGKWFI